VDSSGNIYLAGLFAKTLDFDPGPGKAIRSTGEPLYWSHMHYFLLKLDPSGAFQWVRTWGGKGSQTTRDMMLLEDSKFLIVLDNSSDVYAVSNYFETIDFDPGPGREERSLNPGKPQMMDADQYPGDIFISRFGSDGNYKGVVTWGGPGYDQVLEARVGTAGELYVAGIFNETVDFDPGEGVENRTADEYGSYFAVKFIAQ
jgi:hypothetical protein